MADNSQGNTQNGQNNQQNNSQVTNEDLQKQLNQFTQMIMQSLQTEQNEQAIKKLATNLRASTSLSDIVSRARARDLAQRQLGARNYLAERQLGARKDLAEMQMRARKEGDIRRAQLEGLKSLASRTSSTSGIVLSSLANFFPEYQVPLQLAGTIFNASPELDPVDNLMKYINSQQQMGVLPSIFTQRERWSTYTDMFPEMIVPPTPQNAHEYVHSCRIKLDNIITILEGSRREAKLRLLAKYYKENFTQN